MEKRHVPTLRFKGFIDDWEQRKLGSIVCDYSEKNPVDEDLPILTSSRQGIQKQEEHFGSEQRHDTIDYNVIPRGYCTYRNRSDDRTFTFNVNDCIERGIVSKFYPVFSIDNGNAKFVTEYLNNNFEIKNKLAVLSVGTSQVVLSLNNLKSLDIQIPSKDEQEKIGGYLKSLDNLIALHQRKHKKLLTLKKALLEKMFPQNEEKTPKIRFSGFTSDWEQRKLGDLYAPLTERNADLLQYNRTLSVATMTYRTDGNGAVASSLANYKRLRIGDIAFEGHTSKEFRYGRFVLNDVGDGIMSPRFSALRPLAQMPTNFWKYYIHYETIMKKVLVNSTKAGTMMNELVVDEFLKNSILVPSEKEQTRIGDTLATFDHLITLHQRKLEKLQNIKKAMLEKMFV